MTTDPLDEAAKQLLERLPVQEIYRDAASGATKQVGHLLSDVAKSVRLALFPLQVLGAIQDRLERFVDRAVRRVPESQRVSPAPQIVGPTLEGIRYEPEGSPIDEMFSQILSRAVDSNRLDEAHPAYPVLIKQLSSDEAGILAQLYGKQYDYVWTSDYDARTGLFSSQQHIELDSFPRDILQFPESVGFYMSHLNSLGLAGIFQQGNQEPIMDGPPARQQIGTRMRCKYMLTEIGRRFVQACTAGTEEASTPGLAT